jgi:hypothetical protein
VRFTIDVPFSSLTAQQREQLAAAAQQGLVDVLKTTSVNVQLESIVPGSTVITFVLLGTPSEVAAALPIIQAALRDLLQTMADLLGIPVSDVISAILEDGVPVDPPTGTNVTLLVTALADRDTTNSSKLAAAELETILERRLLMVAQQPAFTGTAFVSVDVTRGNPTRIVMIFTCPVDLAPTLIATFNVAGTTNIIRVSLWESFYVLGGPRVDVDISITVTQVL